jgi:hypothetical protein
MTKATLLTFFLAILGPAVLRAQKFPEHREAQDAQNKGNALLLHMAVGFHLPGGDLSDRFGNVGSAGGGLEWMTEKNYIFGAQGAYFFGQQVKEDPLLGLRTPEGDIIGNDRSLATVALRERGWYIGGVVGRLFPVAQARSGIRVTVGAGWLQHKIRLQDDTRSVPQLSGDYIKGYDRLSGGLNLQEFIGWQHLATNRRANWMIGLELGQGFTRSLRSWDFASGRKLDNKRLDLMFGIRAAWTLPFYFGNAEDIYY